MRDTDHSAFLSKRQVLALIPISNSDALVVVQGANLPGTAHHWSQNGLAR